MLIKYRLPGYEGKWALQRSDLNPETKAPFPRDLLDKEPVRGELVGTPPNANPYWYFSTGLGRWRREPKRGFSFMRHGIHFLLAWGVVVVMAFAAYTLNLDWLSFFLGIGIVSWLFTRYEVVEAAVIHDDAYLDLAGYKVGLLTGIAGYAGLVLALDKLF